MGLFNKKQAGFNVWKDVPEPAYAYKNEKNKSAYVFFIDDHQDKDRILAEKLYAVENTKTMFKIILEKEVYDLTPEYYSEASLFAQLNFYTGVNKEVMRKLLFGSLLIGIGGMFVTGMLLQLSPVMSSMVALMFSLIYMYIFMNKLFNNIIKKHRKIFRDTLISLFGEARLEEMLDVQDAYTEKRNKELHDLRQNMAAPKVEEIAEEPVVESVEPEEVNEENKGE